MKNQPLSLFIVIATLVSNAALAGPCNYNTHASSPTPRFTATDGVEITDLRTSLIWQRCPVGYDFTDNEVTDAQNDDSCIESGTTEFTWAEALQAAADKNAAAGVGEPNNWRVPNVKELMSIVERQCVQPAINEAVFPQPGNFSFVKQFWSSSQSGTGAYSLQFSAGTPEISRRGNDGELLGVYLVRD